METSVLLAKYIGLTYLAIGLGFLCSKSYYERFIKGALKELSMMFIGGLLAFIFGISIVLYHNVWIGSWQIIITLLGWIALIKGFALLTFPLQTMKFYDKFMKVKGFTVFGALFILALGAVLTYFGFFA